MAKIGAFNGFTVGVNTIFLADDSGKILAAHNFGLSGTKHSGYGGGSSKIFSSSMFFGRQVGLGRGKHFMPTGKAGELRLSTGFEGSHYVESVIEKNYVEFQKNFSLILNTNSKKVENKKYISKKRISAAPGKRWGSVIENTIPQGLMDLSESVKKDMMTMTQGLASKMQREIRTGIKPKIDESITEQVRFTNIEKGIICRAYSR